MTRSYHWPLLSTGLILLLIAVGAEHPFFANDETHPASVIFNVHSLAALAKELAFAIFIALIISLGIERQARENDARLAAQARQRIAEDVFRGVFESELPRVYVDAVVRTALKQNVIREYHQVIDTIGPFSEEELRHVGHDAATIRRHHRIATYRLRNVSKDSIRHSVQYMIPVRGGELAHLSRLLRIEVGQEKLDGERLATLRTPDTEESSAQYSYEVEIHPGGSVDVVIEAVVIKEPSDNDVWGNYVPTLRYEHSINFDPPPGAFGMRSVCATSAKLVYADHKRGSARWLIDGPLLPNDSVVLWWRPPT